MTKVVSFDTETRGLNWFEPDERAFLAAWATDRTEYHAVFSDPDQRTRFTEALVGADVIIAHNLAFDVHQVRATIGLDILELGAELHDTDLMSRVLFPEGQRKDRGGHGLKNLAEVYLRADAKAAEDAIKDMGKQIGLRTLKQKGAYYEVWRAFPEVMEHYARMDARYTYDLYAKFRSRLEADAKLWELYRLEMATAPVLIRAEARGVRTDQDHVERLQKLYEQRERDLAAKLDAELGEGAYAGEGSDEALREALLKQGIPLHRKTPTGELATNVFALQEFVDDFPVIADLFAWRRAHKFLSTYLAPMRGREVVHPSFQQSEAWTSRMSCRRPNLQNLPKRADQDQSKDERIRGVFVPREGNVFVVADYDSIEVRLLAWYLGHQEYRDLIREGHDPHAHMASVIWGGEAADYAKGSEVLGLDPARPKLTAEELRDSAKATMFAITYGAGKPRVADMNNISRGQAAQMIATIKHGLPGYYRLMERIRGKIESQGHVRTLMGRKQIVAPEKSYVGLNAVIQGSAADIMKAALVRASVALDGIDWHPILVVHDEILAEGPEATAPRALALLKTAMESAYPLDPPLKASGSIATRSYADA